MVFAPWECDVVAQLRILVPYLGSDSHSILPSFVTLGKVLNSTKPLCCLMYKVGMIKLNLDCMRIK